MTKLVEVRGMGFRTRVRLPSGSAKGSQANLRPKDDGLTRLSLGLFGVVLIITDLFGSVVVFGVFMLISEISEGLGVQIIVGIGLQTLEFSTKVAEKHDGCVYLEPILQGEKMLGFGTRGLVLTMIITDQESGRAWQFSNIRVRNIKTADGNLFHEVTCKTEGKAINRRGACRVWIGESGVASTGLGQPAFDVTVKDISISGIAFICSKDQELSEGTVVHINFRDEQTKTRFDVSAIVVRSEEMERSRIIYGCKLNQESSAISKFVNEKQREKLKAARQSKTLPLK